MSDRSHAVRALYQTLLKRYGPQGWWPLLPEPGVSGGLAPDGGWYHRGLYDFPRTMAQRYEICLGTILTQNTTWLQASRALQNLRAAGLWSPAAMREAPLSKVGEAIRCSGYYSQKARKIVEFSAWLERSDAERPERAELLSLWGVGPETADSMLLYAWGVPVFVVDAYTRRMLSHLNLFPAEPGYEETRAFLEAAVPRDVVVYQEFHALIVAHAKKYFSRKPYGVGDGLEL